MQNTKNFHINTKKLYYKAFMAWLSENLPNTLAVNFRCDLESVRISCMTTIEGKGQLSAHIKK